MSHHVKEEKKMVSIFVMKGLQKLCKNPFITVGLNNIYNYRVLWDNRLKLSMKFMNFFAND